LTERMVRVGVTDRQLYAASREGQQLIQAMILIERADVRRRLILLAESLGPVEDEEEVEIEIPAPVRRHSGRKQSAAAKAGA
jgi:hypothetical protein